MANIWPSYSQNKKGALLWFTVYLYGFLGVLVLVVYLKPETAENTTNLTDKTTQTV